MKPVVKRVEIDGGTLKMPRAAGVTGGGVKRRSGAEQRGILYAGGEGSFGPMDALGDHTVTEQCPGERGLGGEAFAQGEILARPSHGLAGFASDAGVKVGEVM